MEIPYLPDQYHQIGGFSMALVAYCSVFSNYNI